MIIKNKKGVSGIVATLIIILLVLVASGIMWVVLQGVLDEQTSEIDLAKVCMDSNLRATQTENNGTATYYTITLQRNAKGGTLAGAKLIFYNNTDISDVIDYSNDIDALESKRFTIDATITNVTKVEVSGYYLDADGNDNICPQSSAYTLNN